MHAPAESLRWQPHEISDRLFSHFTYIRTEDSAFGIANDAYLPLAGALLGKDTSESSSPFWKLGLLGPPREVQQNDLVGQILQDYCRVTGNDVSHIVSSVTLSLHECRAYSNMLRDRRRFRIDVWLPASAASAYIALLFSHLSLYHQVTKQRAPLREVKMVEQRISHYLLLLRMIGIAVAEGGTMVFEEVKVEPSLPQSVRLGIDLFRAALTFIVFHEMAHIQRSHHCDRQTGAERQAENHAHEFEADCLALTWMKDCRFITPWSAFRGGMIFLLSSSLMTKGPDVEPSVTHPSLVDRFKLLCQFHDKLINQRQGVSLRFAVPYLQNLLANLHDRDRCPDWLHKDRLEVLGLPADHPFDGPRITYRSVGKQRVVDAKMTPAHSRKL